MGDRYPSSEIVGVDIGANVPSYVPPNVRFEIDDVEGDWTWSAPFDYVHSRYMVGAIKDWKRYVHQCYE